MRNQLDLERQVAAGDRNVGLKDVQEFSPTATLATPFWPRELALGLMPLLLGFQILVWTAYLPKGLHGIADFRQLYTGGHILRSADRHSLYNYSVQQEIENRVVPVGAYFALPINHPAYEEILFLPLSFLTYRAAFLLFLLLNVCILGLSAYLLAPRLEMLAQRWRPLPYLVFVAAFPITRAVLQGQDSIILLGLLIFADRLLLARKDLTAGVLVGLGMFKFEIVLPIAVMFVLWKRWRFVKGFGFSLLLTTICSLLLVGAQGVRQYAEMLLSMSIYLKPGIEAASRYATIPSQMLNLRGFISAALANRIPHPWVQAAIVVCSVMVLVFAWRQKPSFPLAIVVAGLVSYHFIAHDASVLMLPIALCLCSNSAWIVVTAIACLLFPIAALVPAYGYIGGIPFLGLLFAFSSARMAGLDEGIPTPA